MPKSLNENLLRLLLWLLWTSNIINAWGVLRLYGTGLRIGACLLCGGVGAILILTSQSWNRRAVYLLIPPFIVALVSLTYSLAPLFGLISIISGFGTMMFFLGLAHEWREYYWKKLVSYSYPIWIVTCFFSLAQYITGGWGDLRFRTILGGGNSFGPFAAVLLWFSCIKLTYVQHSRIFRTVVSCSIFLALLVVSTCRTAIGAFVVLSFVLLSVLHLERLGRKLCLILLVGSLVCALLVVDLKSDIFIRGQSNYILDEEKLDGLLAGRIYIWQHAIMAIREKPLWGYGIGSTGIAIGLMAKPSETIHYLSGDVRSDVHNSYLASVVALGLLGSLPFFIVFFVTSWLGLRMVSTRGAPDIKSLEQFGALAIGLICAFTSINLFSASTPGDALTWCAIVGILMRPCRMSTELFFKAKTSKRA